MRSRRTWLAAGICAALGISLAGYQLWRVANGGGIPQAALDKLYASEFPDLTNRSRRLEEFRGKVIVLNFWATWCPPCRKEMPAFSRLQEKLGAQGVQFVGLGIDSPSAIKEYALQAPVSYPLLIGGSAGMELMREVGNPNAALPYTLVLDRNARPAMAHTGMLTEELMAEKLAPLLGR